MQEFDLTKKKLAERTQKLAKFAEVIKTFDEQIQAFEAFEKKANTEIDSLQNQVKYFKDLYEKEKFDKEDAIRKLRPSQRPIHESLKRQMEGRLSRGGAESSYDTN